MFFVKSSSHSHFFMLQHHKVTIDRTIQAMSRERELRDHHIEQLFGMNHYSPLPPVPQSRHRHRYCKSTGMRTYDPNRDDKSERRTQVMHYLSTHFDISREDLPLTKSCVSVDVTFLISRPISHFIRNDRSRGVHRNFLRAMPTTQGDIDNLVKFFLDSMEGTFFANDRDVVTVKASKLYTTAVSGRTVYNIRHHNMNIIDLFDGEESI